MYEGRASLCCLPTLRICPNYRPAYTFPPTLSNYGKLDFSENGNFTQTLKSQTCPNYRQQCLKTHGFPRDILWARFCDIFCAKLTRSCHGLQFSRWFLFPRCPVHIMCVLFILMYNCTFHDQGIHSKPIQSSKLHYSSRTIMCISCHLIVRAEFWLSEQNSFTVHINLLLHIVRPDNLQVSEAGFRICTNFKKYLSKLQNLLQKLSSVHSIRGKIFLVIKNITKSI